MSYDNETINDLRTGGVTEDTDELLNADTVVNHVCRRCGNLLRTLAEVGDHDEECTGEIGDAQGGIVSEAEGSLDTMVEAASVPNLAALFQQGKKQGLLKPGHTEGASF